MLGQRLRAVEMQIPAFVEGNRAARRNHQSFGGTNPVEDVRDLIHGNFLRGVAFQAEQHGPVCAVTCAGERQRTVKGAVDAFEPFDDLGPGQTFDETARGAHGAHRVGTAGPNANREHVQDTDHHRRL